MLGLDKAIGGEKQFTYLGIFRLLLSLWVQFGDLQAFELALLIHWTRSYVSYMLMDSILQRLCTVMALHKVPCMHHMHHIFLLNHQNTILPKTKQKNSTLDCLFPQWHPWGIDHNVALLYLVKISHHINRSSAFPISWLEDANTWAFCELQWLTKAIWNTDESHVIRSLSGASCCTVTNQSIQCLQHM